MRSIFLLFLLQGFILLYTLNRHWSSSVFFCCSFKKHSDADRDEELDRSMHFYFFCHVKRPSQQSQTNVSIMVWVFHSRSPCSANCSSRSNCHLCWSRSHHSCTACRGKSYLLECPMARDRKVDQRNEKLTLRSRRWASSCCLCHDYRPLRC